MRASDRSRNKYRPHYQEKFGVPVNHEDMLATIMAFSYLLIDGMRRLDLELQEAEAEDLYYAWRVFALLMGIHPDGRPHDDSLIPATLAEAAEFYASYVRRNNTMPRPERLRRRAGSGQSQDDGRPAPAIAATDSAWATRRGSA